jgi:endonuclease/exonuclease/phosphatase family metal-dependent hydrolase
MKRFFAISGSILGLLVLGLTLFFVWASTGRLPAEDLAQQKTYSAAPAEVQDSLTVMTYNIGYLSGMTNNEPVVRSDSFLAANMEQATRLIREADPDVIGFQEIDYGAARSGSVHQLDTVATRLGYAAAAQAVNWDERYIPFPYGRPAVHFGRTVSGQAILSRVPIRGHERVVLTRPPQWFGRDAFYLDRLAQVGVLDLGGRALVVVSVHLEAFDQETRVEQAGEVRALYDRLAAQGAPVLLIGDFNSELPASGARGGADPDDPTLPRLLDGTGLRPVLSDSVRSALDVSGTYPADAPARTIDHIFYPPAWMTPTARSVRCDAPSPPSDHCAVTASFRLREPPTGWPAPADLPPLDRLRAE